MLACREGELWRETLARRCSVSRSLASSSCSCSAAEETFCFLSIINIVSA